MFSRVSELQTKSCQPAQLVPDPCQTLSRTTRGMMFITDEATDPPRTLRHSKHGLRSCNMKCRISFAVPHAHPAGCPPGCNATSVLCVAVDGKRCPCQLHSCATVSSSRAIAQTQIARSACPMLKQLTGSIRPACQTTYVCNSMAACKFEISTALIVERSNGTVFHSKLFRRTTALASVTQTIRSVHAGSKRH